MSFKLGKTAESLVSIVVIVLIVFAALRFGPGILDELSGIGLPPGVPEIPDIDIGKTYDAAALSYRVQEGITGTSVKSGASGGDIFLAEFVGGAKMFNFLAGSETNDDDTSPMISEGYYGQGEHMVMMLFSDVDAASGGTGKETYGAGYHWICEEGAGIYRFDGGNLVEHNIGGQYYYTFISDGVRVGTVHYSGGTTNYWDLGVLHVWCRVVEADLDISVQYGTTVLAGITDGSTHGDTEGVGGVGTTPTTVVDDFELDVIVVSDSSNLAWGLSTPYVGAGGRYHDLRSVVTMASNCTVINEAKLAADGWIPVEDTTLYAADAYYKVIDPWHEYTGLIPNKAGYAKMIMQIPLDFSAAAGSTGYNIQLFFNDYQLEENVRGGSPSTTLPTFYGGQSDFGADTCLTPQYYSTSSGIPAVTGTTSPSVNAGVLLPA